MSRRRVNLINFGADVKYNNSRVGVCVPGKTSQAIKNVFSVIMYCARGKKSERVRESEEKKNVLQPLLRGTTMDITVIYVPLQ